TTCGGSPDGDSRHAVLDLSEYGSLRLRWPDSFRHSPAWTSIYRTPGRGAKFRGSERALTPVGRTPQDSIAPGPGHRNCLMDKLKQAAVLVLLAGADPLAGAKAFPDRAVRVIVPYAP